MHIPYDKPLVDLYGNIPVIGVRGVRYAISLRWLLERYQGTTEVLGVSPG